VTRAAVGAAILLSAAQAAGDPPDVRLEVASGVDTNVTRVEDEPGQGERRDDGLVRAVLEVQEATRPTADVTLAGNLHVGAKHFFRLEGEDTLLQRADGSVAVRLLDGLTLRVDAQVRDRSSRDPERPRDYTDLAAGTGFDARLGDLGMSLRGFASRFLYAPDDDLSSTAYGASLRLGHPAGPLGLSAGASLVRRDFEGPRLTVTGTHGIAAVVGEAEGERRRDDVARFDARVDYVGDWIAQLEYAYEVDDSNSHGGGFARHLVSASAHVALPLGLLASGEASLQRLVHADPQHFTPELFVEDEDRSAVSVRLERPLGGDFALVGSGAFLFSPKGTGPAYDRQTFLLGVAYERE
jgi:hypothetical protein